MLAVTLHNTRHTPRIQRQDTTGSSACYRIRVRRVEGGVTLDHRIPSARQMTTENSAQDWTSAWPDALAFGAGLAVAWRAGWAATDLVWSLWLSSLAVGYAMIVWTIVRPGVDFAHAAWRERATMSRMLAGPQRTPAVVGGLILIVGALLLLAFFTFHFGMFHYVHSQFLISFFPIDSGHGGRHGMAGMSTYLEVVRRYWWFLPSAFLAERGAFLRQPLLPKPDVSVTAEAIARRKAANASSGVAMLAPYRQVMRMHLLIFFFFFAHAVRLGNFAVYAVVYAVYFFPWRLVRRPAPVAVPAPLAPE